MYLYIYHDILVVGVAGAISLIYSCVRQVFN